MDDAEMMMSSLFVAARESWTTRMLLKDFKQSLYLKDVYYERFPKVVVGVVLPSLCITHNDWYI